MIVNIKFEIVKTFWDGDKFVHSFIGSRPFETKDELSKVICNCFTGTASQESCFAVADKDITPAKLKSALRYIELTKEYQPVYSFNPSDDMASVMTIFVRQESG